MNLPTLTALLLLAAPAVAGESRTTYAASPASGIAILGSTNVHDWTCHSDRVAANLSVDARRATVRSSVREAIDRIRRGADYAASLDRLPTPGMSLSIPVRSLKCGNDRMEGDLRKALNATAHPGISFRFVAVEHVEIVDPSNAQPRLRLSVRGDLTIAGVTRVIAVPVDMVVVTADVFSFDGSIGLRMSDFGVTPPVALFGLIRADDMITVRFSLVLAISSGE